MYIFKYANPCVCMDFLYMNIAKNYSLNDQKVLRLVV